MCGWTAWHHDPDDLPQDALLLYATPDQLLADSASSPDLDDLLLGYQQLLSHATQHRLLSTWRLQACSDDQLTTAGLTSPAEALAWPAADPLAALITKQVLDAHPALLDAYLDLELKADLLGGEPDSRYRKRLMEALQPNALLQAWRQPSALSAQLSEAQQQCAEAQQQLTEAREEAELTLLQLHQVQEELEHYFLLSREHTSELEQLRAQESGLKAERDGLQAQLQEREQAHQQQLSEAQQQGTEAQQQLTEAREEAELTLLQLHQVQEELEHYFLLSRSQASQLERYDHLLRRSEGLLSVAAV